jgi:MATE family multidrug resistance protein
LGLFFVMYKAFLKLTLPNILTNLTVPLVSLVDLALMGHLGNSSYIVALGLAVALFNLIYWAFGFLRMGTTGQVAQLYGRDDSPGIHLIVAQGIFIAITIGVGFLLLQRPILYLYSELINITDDIQQQIGTYFDVRIYAAPASITVFVINGWLLGIQKSRSALVLAIVINVVNVVLSYAFVRFYAFGIAGVAIGTLIAQYTGLLVGIFFLWKEYKWTWAAAFFIILRKGGQWQQFIQINSDLFIRTLCLLFTLTFFKVKASELEVNLGAANLLLLEFITISAYGIDGLAFAAESISGKYYGSGNLISLKKSIRAAFLIGLGIAVLVSMVFFVFSDLILLSLTNQELVILEAKKYLPWVIIAPVVYAVAFIWDGIYIGCTASKQMKWSLLISTFVVFLPCYYLFGNVFGNHGIWLALTLFMISRGFIQSMLVKKGIYNRLHVAKMS